MKVVIIGAGVGGLGSACLLSRAGHDVTVLEKNSQTGGRAGSFKARGFTFDTGPSWYLMPEVFEDFFKLLGENVEDHLDLIKLDPSCRLTFAGRGQQIDLTVSRQLNKKAFEAIEPGAGKQLDKYLQRSEYIYNLAMDKLLYKNYDSIKSLPSPGLLKAARQLALLTSLDKYDRRYFKDECLRQIMEFPSVFLGSSPYKTPAFYSLLSHVVFNQGVYYPRGGMYELIKSLETLAKQNGAKLKFNESVEKILTTGGRIVGVRAGGKDYEAEVVISNAGVHHTETKLLSSKDRDYNDSYWLSRQLAPSALLMYLGVDRQYDSLQHHNLVFSQVWSENFAQIYDHPEWPDKPSFYVCAPGKTDSSVAPSGQENLFVLVPLAPGLAYDQKKLEKYSAKILGIMEQELKLPGIKDHIIFKKLFSVKDFEAEFNSFRGTGLGLAHTLRQTAAGRPRNCSRKVNGLYYVGADVHPGIGLPSVLISAQLVAQRLTPSGRF